MTITRYPSLELIKSVFSNSLLLEQVGLKDISEIVDRYYNGCFVLPSFINLPKEFICGKGFEKTEFAQNTPLLGGVATGGCALLSLDTIKRVNQKRSSKRSKYSNSIFHTGHILGHQLIFNIEEFNKNPSNVQNVFPQTKWANKSIYSPKDPSGWNFSLTENLIINALRSKRNIDGHLRIYYKVDLLYLEEEQVPRALVQQVVSNDANIFSDTVRLIPNIDLSHKINYSKWNHEGNLLVDSPP